MPSTLPVQGLSGRQSSEEKPPFRQLVKQTPETLKFTEEMKVNSTKLGMQVNNTKLDMEPNEASQDEHKEVEHMRRKRSSNVWKKELEEKLFYRAAEEATVVDCYEKMLSEPEISTLLLVTGPTGTGKTRLVKHALQKRVQDQGGYFLRGKFDQLCRPEPYRGLVSAFTEFTSQVVERGPEAVDAVRFAIRKAVGDECCVLVSMIPALARIFGIDQSQCKNSSKADDAIQRFVFAFRMFMRAVSSLEQPMVLLLDDLQWADPCSIDIISSIVTDLKNNQGLFVVGTCDVKSNDNYLSQKLRELETSGSATITNVSINNLELGEVNHLLGNVLQLSRLDETEALGMIVNGQTNGNFFYIIEFIRWMQDSGLLLFDSKIGSWIWDVDEIRMTIDLCHVGDFLTDKLEQLPMEMRDVLKVAACFGSHFEETLIEYVLDCPVGTILTDAVGIGVLLLEGAPGQYAFEHDGIQEAAYRLIPESGRELFHLEVGRRLWRRLSKEDLDRNIFVLLSQMNIGKRLITREKERYAIASLCLHAGKKAAKSSTFRIATIYLNLAIDLLGDRSWRDEYDLSLAIYNAAAEMDMCTANFEAMETLVESVLKHARCPSDKIQAQATKIYAMGACNRQQEALDLGIAVLAGLGEHFRRHMCKGEMISELHSVQRMLKGKSNEQLMRLPNIEDGDILSCLQILNLMFLHALLVRPKLAPFVTLKLMKLTLTHGLSMIAPTAFATYGMLCVSGMNDVDAAFRFGGLGLELLKRLEVNEYLPRVYAAYYGCIHTWKKPLRDSLAHVLHAHRVGMQTGDMEFSSLNANLYCFIAIDAGVPLDEIEREWAGFQQTMKNHRQESLLRMSIPCMQAVKLYRGEPVDKRETDALLQYCIENKLHSTVNGIRLSRMRIAYLFNDYELADSLSIQFSRRIWALTPTFELVSAPFVCAMVSLAMAAKGKRVRQNVRKAKKMIKKLKYFARMCPSNCLDKKFLLEAELAAVYGQEAKAFEKYVCAIALAKDNRLLFIEALANERCAKFLVARGKLSDAELYFRHALALYDEWGGKAKVDSLRADVESLYDQSFFSHPSGLP